MTKPPSEHATHETGWGRPLPEPAGAAPDGTHPPRRRRVVRDTLAATSVVAGVAAWVAIGIIVLGVALLASVSESDWVAQFLAVVVALAVLVPAAVVAAGVALVALCGAIPLAVAWFRTPDRPAGPGLLFAHAVVVCGVVAAGMAMYLLAD